MIKSKDERLYKEGGHFHFPQRSRDPACNKYVMEVPGIDCITRGEFLLQNKHDISNNLFHDTLRNTLVSAKKLSTLG